MNAEKGGTSARPCGWVNIHIALKAKPPRRGVPGREQWSAEPERFMEMYGSHPERLRNLHFSFVVLLRAVRKAAPALAKMDLRLGQDPQAGPFFWRTFRLTFRSFFVIVCAWDELGGVAVMTKRLRLS